QPPDDQPSGQPGEVRHPVGNPSASMMRAEASATAQLVYPLPRRIWYPACFTSRPMLSRSAAVSGGSHRLPAGTSVTRYHTSYLPPDALAGGAAGNCDRPLTLHTGSRARTLVSLASRRWRAPG